jgi:outer membrane protein
MTRYFILKSRKTNTFYFLLASPLLGLPLGPAFAQAPAPTLSYEVYQKSPVHELARKLITEVERPNTGAPFNTLKKDINAAFNSVPAVLKTVDALNALDAQKEQAFAGFLPKVSVTVGAGKTDQNQISYQSDGNQNNRAIAATQTLYDFGTTIGAYQAAGSRYTAGQYNKYNQHNEILLKLITSTLDVQRAKKSYQFSLGYVDTRREFLNKMKEKDSLGATSKLDVTRAETKIAEASDEMVANAKQVENANATYRELFGKAPSFIESAYQLPFVDIKKLANSEDIIESLGAFKELEFIANATKNDYLAARGKLFGALSLEANNSRNNNPPLVAATVNTVQVVYRVDVFNGFAQTEKARELFSKQSESIFEKERLRRDLLKRLDNAKANFQAARDSLQSRLNFLKGSQATDIATRELFFFGKASLTDVFKAQEDYFMAAQKLVNAEFDHNVAYFSLLALYEQLQKQFDLGS